MGSSEQSFQCKRCFANLSDADTLLRHMDVHMLLPNRPPPPPTPPQPKADKNSGIVTEAVAAMKKPNKRQRTTKLSGDLQGISSDGQTSVLSSIGDGGVVAVSRTSRMGGGGKKTKPLHALPLWQLKPEGEGLRSERPATKVPDFFPAAVSGADHATPAAAKGPGRRGRKPKVKVEDETVDSRAASQSSNSANNTPAVNGVAHCTARNNIGDVSPLSKILRISEGCLTMVNTRARQQDGVSTVADLAPELYISITTMINSTMQNHFPDHQLNDAASSTKADGAALLENVAQHFDLISRTCQTFELESADNQLSKEVMPLLWVVFCRLRRLLAVNDT